jgi:hypothetical protein
VRWFRDQQWVKDGCRGQAGRVVCSAVPSGMLRAAAVCLLALCDAGCQHAAQPNPSRSSSGSARC